MELWRRRGLSLTTTRPFRTSCLRCDPLAIAETECLASLSKLFAEDVCERLRRAAGEFRSRFCVGSASSDYRSRLQRNVRNEDFRRPPTDQTVTRSGCDLR